MEDEEEEEEEVRNTFHFAAAAGWLGCQVWWMMPDTPDASLIFAAMAILAARLNNPILHHQTTYACTSPNSSPLPIPIF